MGVPKPADRNSPAAASINSLRKWLGDSNPATPSWNKAIAAPKRRQSRPIPGQPLAKVENRRCRNSSLIKVTRVQQSIETLKEVWKVHSFE
jgi:hypothetical protein